MSELLIKNNNDSYFEKVLLKLQCSFSFILDKSNKNEYSCFLFDSTDSDIIIFTLKLECNMKDDMFTVKQIQL